MKRDPLTRQQRKTLSREQRKALWSDVRKAALFSFITTICCLIFPALSLAQAVNIDLGSGAGLTDRVVQLIGLLTVLTLPSAF